jgi:aryl-alcohol dehydrogenase-like predicted oxidoreductase
MKYVNLGRSGLKVSRICLGTMAYANGAGGAHPWALSEEASRPFYKRAFEAGINFYDTANVYSFGTSEEFLGRAVKKYAKRDEVVIATKVHGEMRPGDPERQRAFAQAHPRRDRSQPEAAGHGLRRSLPNPPPRSETPIEETLEALHDVVKSGKARYIGASSMYAWQFMQALALQKRKRLVALHLDAEPSELALSRGRARNAAALRQSRHRRHSRGRRSRAGAWRGRRTRRRNAARPTSSVTYLYRKTVEADRAVLERVGEIAAERGISRGQVALAWHFTKPAVTAPIVGATKLEQLERCDRRH